MKVEPLYDNILVKRLEAEAKTEGGIILPDSAKEKPKQGQVVATGKGSVNESGKRNSLSVKKGDTVIFASYAGNDLEVDGEEYLIMKEEDILAVVE